MIRKLAVALSLTTALSASVVQALGLGEASVESTLNQPLKAEIELVNIRDLEDNEILPGLASREEFLKAGVERIYFLSDVRFEVEHKDDGRVVVNLTTNKPVREPFLNFLVEVIWPSGRLLREYALLIDPPIFSDEPLTAVQQVESSPTSELSNLPESGNVSTATTQYAAAVPTSSSTPSGGDTYGPTNNSDTMWAIALQVRPDNSVTAQQTMLAIQELNPDSFINNNINSLKTGQILRLPGINEIRQLSKRDAVRGVITQNRSFENKALTRNVVDAAPEESTQQQTTSTDDIASTKATGDELKLVVAEGSDADQQSGAHAGDSATVGSSSALKNDLDITLEKLDQSNLEKKELNSRVTDLEEQLETLQRLLTLKDDQLANLQTQMGQSDSETEAGTPPESAEVADEGLEKVSTTTEGSQGTDKTTANIASVSPETVMPEEAVEAKPIDVKPVQAPAVVESPAAVTSVQEEKPVTKSISVQSVMDLVLNNPIYQALAAGVVVLLLLIVWGLSRRNAQKEQEFFETRNDDGEEPGDIFEVEAEAGSDDSESTNIEGDDEDESSVSDEPVTDVQSETEDVIAEADIYIAYGRLDQASQLLENSISSQPQRVDIRIKLLEVYAESNEIEAFDKQFNEIEALGDDYALEQATLIKAGLEGAEGSVSIDDLENQLLSGEPEEAAESDGYTAIEYESPKQTTETELSEDLLSVDDELSELESGLEFDNSADVADNLAEEDDLDIDFDINEIDLDSDDSGLEDLSNVELESDDLTVSLGDADLDLSVDGGLDVSLEEAPLESVDDLDLDLDLALSTDDVTDVVGDDLDSDVTESEIEVEDDFDISLDESELDALAEDLSLDDSSDDADLDESELSLDDLDLELDKIDSDLDVNFDAESDDIEPEEVVELDDDLNLDLDGDVESGVEELGAQDLSEELDAQNLSEELDGIVDVLTEEDTLSSVPAEEQVLGSTELDSAIDDSLLESAELELDEGDSFESELTDDEDFDFLAGTDEAATKLDLARAYIDMGDADGAKDILEEVFLEGNDEQKQDAQDLLKTLD